MAYKWFWWPQIFCIWERCEPEVLAVVPGSSRPGLLEPCSCHQSSTHCDSAQITATFLYSTGGTQRLCSWSFVSAPQGNPLLLSTSEHTLHPEVRWVLVWQAVGLVLSGVHSRKGVEEITGPLFLISLNQQWNYPECHIAFKSEFCVAKLASEVFYKHLVAQQLKNRPFS